MVEISNQCFSPKANIDRVYAGKRKANYAVFVVHEFLSKGIDPVKISQNAKDFEFFVRLLSWRGKIHMASGILNEVGYVKGGRICD